MGVALRGQGKLDKAMDTYNKALLLRPDYTDAHNNIGIVFQDQGKLDEAIEAYNKALSIKPDYAAAWNNLYFALQAIKLQINPDQNLNELYPTDINSNIARIELSM